jgi:hypothetical protein
LRCTGLHNVARCTELRIVETARKCDLVLHRIAHNCTRWRPARSHRRYAIRTSHRHLGPLPIDAIDAPAQVLGIYDNKASRTPTPILANEA